MRIRIKNNAAKLQAAIDLVEGKATQRTISAYDLDLIAKESEKRLAALCLRKSDMPGAVVSYRMGLNLPNSYRYQPEYTHVTIERGASGWFLVAVGRFGGSNKQAEHYSITLTANQADQARQRFSGKFRVAA